MVIVKQERHGLLSRFSPLVEELKNSEVPAYQGTVLALINCVIISCDGLLEKIRIRNEFIGRQFDLQPENIKWITCATIEQWFLSNYCFYRTQSFFTIKDYKYDRLFSLSALGVADELKKISSTSDDHTVFVQVRWLIDGLWMMIDWCNCFIAASGYVGSRNLSPW